jgi:hypothetical protein
VTFAPAALTFSIKVELVRPATARPAVESETNHGHGEPSSYAVEFEVVAE